MSPLITLTTDFGTRDPYVASMKGVIATICPAAQVVDLTHEIAPQSILEGALFAAAACPCFPKDTVHVLVVDPGVGAENPDGPVRLPIAVLAGGQCFVCPNNGLLTLVTRTYPFDEARAISNPRFMGDRISPTFHGRDVFAPAAARLAGGAPFADVGERLERLVELAIPRPALSPKGGMTGEVIHIDRFGNAVTNIHASAVGAGPIREVQAASLIVRGPMKTYGDVDPGQPLALFGSSGYLEIAVNRGNAAAEFGMRRGDPVATRP